MVSSTNRLFCLLCACFLVSSLSYAAESGDDERGNSGPFKRDSKPVKDDSDEELPPLKAPEKKAEPASKPEAKPEAKPAFCTQCLGTGFLPSAPKAYVHLPNEPLIAANAIPWKHCSKCGASRDAKELLETEANRLSKSTDQYKNWEQRLGMKFLPVDTHHATIYSQLPLPQAKAVGDALEQLTAHLQTVTKVTLLTGARPDSQEIFLLSDNGNFTKFIDVMTAGRPAEEIALAKKCTSITNAKVAVMFFNPTPNEDKAVFALAKMMILEAFGTARAPDWLVEGFSSYCENAVTKKNLCYSIQYEFNQVKFGQNWNADVAKLARDGQLRKWDEIFVLSMIGLKAREYITCYSMVGFLMKLDGAKFARMVVNIRDGMDSQKAMEKAYGRSVGELQGLWAAWCQTLK